MRKEFPYAGPQQQVPATAPGGGVYVIAKQQPQLPPQYVVGQQYAGGAQHYAQTPAPVGQQYQYAAGTPVYANVYNAPQTYYAPAQAYPVYQNAPPGSVPFTPKTAPVASPGAAGHLPAQGPTVQPPANPTPQVAPQPGPPGHLPPANPTPQVAQAGPPSHVPPQAPQTAAQAPQVPPTKPNAPNLPPFQKSNTGSMKTPVQPLTGANQLTEPKPEPSPGSTTPKGTLSRTNTDTVTAKYPASQAPFKRFTYYFIPVPPEKNFTIFDLQTTHKLDKAKTRGIPSTIVNFNGRKHIFDLETCTYHPESDPKFVKNFQIVRRPEQWYYQDVDGTIQPYDPETNFKIFSGKENGLEIIPDVKIGHHEYEINLKEMKQRNKKTSTERIIYSESVITSMKNWPVFIDKKTKVPEGETTMIRQLNENEPEYKKVEAYFRMNMASFILKKERTLTGSKTELIPTNKITKIEKIVNPKLREQWEFLLEKIKRDNNDNNKNIEYTKLLWHGSGTLPPPVIYQDVHYGWKINYSSAKNLWGPGLYFGEDAQYCHKYVYRTGGRRQIFLAEVIIGDDIISLEDDTIREPWMKDDGKTRYDSVCGVRHEKSWIWVVYASGRAYPCYLLEYED